jgi:hypothetical protein
MQTVHSALGPIPAAMARFAQKSLPAELSQPGGGMKGPEPRRRDIMPRREGVAGSVWGRPAAPPALSPEPSVCSIPDHQQVPSALRPKCCRKEPMNALREIKRIRARSALGLWLLISLWLFICLFVLAAIGLHWKL